MLNDLCRTGGDANSQVGTSDASVQEGIDDMPWEAILLWQL